MRIAAILVAACTAFPALAQSRTSVDVQAWYHNNGLCRGSNDPREVRLACNLREVIGARLERSGMCYGKTTEPLNDQTWHRCGPQSR